MISIKITAWDKIKYNYFMCDVVWMYADVFFFLLQKYTVEYQFEKLVSLLVNS